MKLRDLWPFRPRVARDVPVLQDVWALITGQTSYPRPSMADLEAAYEENGAVFSCIKEIAEAVASAEVQADSTTRTLLEHPNVLQDWLAFVTQLLASKLCTGTAYVLKAPRGSAAVQELHVLRTVSMELVRGGIEKPILGYRYDDGRTRFVATPEQIIFWGSPSSRAALPFPNAPVSPVSAEWSSVLVDNAIRRYQRETLGRLPYLVGVVETEGATSKPQRDDLQLSLQDIMGGKTLVLPQGAHMVAPGLVNDITLSDLAASCEARLCAAFGVHPLLVGFIVGLQNSPWSQYSEARKSFYTETIEPLLVQVGNLLSRGLGKEITLKLRPEPEPEETAKVEGSDDERDQRIPDKP